MLLKTVLVTESYKIILFFYVRFWVTERFLPFVEMTICGSRLLDAHAGKRALPRV
jgi:hypothetical protein